MLIEIVLFDSSLFLLQINYYFKGLGEHSLYTNESFQEKLNIDFQSY